MTQAGKSRYAKSQALLARAEKVIPTGTQTFSKSPLQFPIGQAPHFLERGRGGRVWDVDGNEYIDLMAGLLPVLFGYGDPDVDAAIRAQMEKGITFSLASPLETDLAEKLQALIPSAEMVRYGKNGTDATSAAIRLARAYTGRDYVIACGYHGWQDWYIGATVRNKGVPARVAELTLKRPFNDLEALHAAFAQYPEQIAAVIMEPAGGADPKEGYLEAVQELARDKGAVLIFDEIVTGFRFAAGGAQALFGVTPDLSAFGKALGNGMPIAAVVGKAEIMREMEEIFFSSTFGGETLSLAAALAVIDKLQREPVIETLYDTGTRLAEGVQALLNTHGLEAVISLSGRAPWKLLAFQDHPHGSRWAIRTLFQILMLEQGVLMTGSHNVMYAHNEQDITAVLAAYEEVLPQLAAALLQPGLEDRLEGSLVQPVFAVRS